LVSPVSFATGRAMGAAPTANTGISHPAMTATMPNVHSQCRTPSRSEGGNDERVAKCIGGQSCARGARDSSGASSDYAIVMGFRLTSYDISILTK